MFHGVHGIFHVFHLCFHELHQFLYEKLMKFRENRWKHGSAVKTMEKLIKIMENRWKPWRKDENLRNRFRNRWKPSKKKQFTPMKNEGPQPLDQKSRKLNTSKGNNSAPLLNENATIRHQEIQHQCLQDCFETTHCVPSRGLVPSGHRTKYLKCFSN